jgi:chromate reductase
MPTSPVKLFGLSGSLRKGSFTRAILKTMAEAVASQAQVEIGDLGSIPLFNQDDEGDRTPASVIAMRKAVTDSQGIVIVTPEYNHGTSGVLKNCIDWLSRPPNPCLVGKPVLVLSSSPGALGGVRAQPQLRETLRACGARPIMNGEIVIGGVSAKITDGKLTDKASLDFALKGLQQLINEVQGSSAAKAA